MPIIGFFCVIFEALLKNLLSINKYLRLWYNATYRIINDC